ncbi:recombinase family protein [Streptomyces sp. NBC_01005]|uniref:recombinase family protein n=1 Tax=unclassified Streptomyces TaxID=2593676 RepID=UPI0038697471|nr:recombinase family protein [Streptomyces sp. NBC_01005]WTC99615.1 recombinase family protein [Streptomyces sp. NBC_01650]
MLSFADKKSGKNSLRPELKACHAFLDSGDTLVVPSLDRYGRRLQDLINVVAALRERGIGFTSLYENLDPPAADSSSASSPPWRNSSANSSSSAPTRAWLPPAFAAASADSPPSPPRKSSAPPVTSCPTPADHIPDLRELSAGAVPRRLEARTRQADPSKIVLTGISCTSTTHTRTPCRVPPPTPHRPCS